MRILLVQPPATEPSGPYPAIAYLAGYLKTIGHSAAIADASLALVLRVLSCAGVQDVAREAARSQAADDPMVRRFLSGADWYADTVDVAVRCLQGRDAGAIALCARPGWLPPPLDAGGAWASGGYLNAQVLAAELGGLTSEQRRAATDAGDLLRFAFGVSADHDRAQFLALALVADVAAVVGRAVDPAFSLTTYASHLVAAHRTFDALAARLAGPPTLIDTYLDEIGDALAAAHRPELAGVSVPFAGCLYGALRIARRLKRADRSTTVVLGGGWVNTELRELAEPRLFDDVDAVTLDDGERPLTCLIEWRAGCRDIRALKRTFVRIAGAVTWCDGAIEPDVPMKDWGTPSYAGLPLEAYLAFRQPGQRLWGRRWNKLTLAHGCYWKRCAFCDTALAYIAGYAPATLDDTVARIRALVAETGETGFHFVDEAMPPALLGRLAGRLIASGPSISWWGNVRFDAALEVLAPELARAGCIGITGGLEVASDRVLGLIDKGISLATAARVAAAFAREGVFVHAYLIYGFPTQTTAETVDALEYVRQLFAAGALHSAVWHRFMLTVHSPVARDPARFGITLGPQAATTFARYILDYDEPDAAPHEQFAGPLERALQHFRVGAGLDRPVCEWFREAGLDVAPPSLAPSFVADVISGARR